jgi:hypothetical protein
VQHDHLLPGELFPKIAVTLNEQRQERRMTLKERCQKVAELIDHNEPAVVWCQYNDEGDYLEKIIPEAVQIAGRDTDEDKERRLLDFTYGKNRVLITKPKIGAGGLNWQHCGHQTFFPSHSFEQYYQAVRRSWRFGRTQPVKIDIVTTEGEAGVTANLQKKQRNADKMFEVLVAEMRNAEKTEMKDNFTKKVEVPSWV